MAAHVKSTLSTMWGNFTMVIEEFPLLSAAEQTRLSWARLVPSYAEVPQIFQAYFDAQCELRRPFPYAVLTPSYEGFLSRTTEKMLCAYGAEIDILERTGNQFMVTTFARDEITLLEVGEILLKSWITLHGKIADGTHTSQTLKFNTVTDFLFVPVLHNIRGGSNTASEANMNAERAKFNYLAQSNFKFMNAARRSILAGESVLQSIMQPEIRKPVATLFGHSLLRTVYPTHICILTDKELILVREDHQKTWDRDIKHGSIQTFIPLGKIAGFAITEAPKNLLLLTLDIPNDAPVELLFVDSHRYEIDRLLDRLSQLTAGAKVMV